MFRAPKEVFHPRKSLAVGTAFRVVVLCVTALLFALLLVHPQQARAESEIDYQPFYFRSAWPIDSRWIPGYTGFDVGTLVSTPPTDPESRCCGGWVQYYFDEPGMENEEATVENIYYRVWWAADIDEAYLGHGYGCSTSGFDPPRDWLPCCGFMDECFTFNVQSAQTIVDGYRLSAVKYVLNTPIEFPDYREECPPELTAYDFTVKFRTTHPALYGDAHKRSFILFNVPDSAILQTLDSDSDTLNDYDELFTYVTDPFEDDTDADGYSDYAEVIGLTNPNDPQRAPVFGADLKRFESSGDHTNEQHGHAVSAIGDCDGDGTEDVVVSSVANVSDAGLNAVSIYSSATGGLLERFDGFENQDGFGHSISPISDQNGDDKEDLVIGGPYVRYNDVKTGSVFVYSSTGSLLLRLNGDSSGDSFGYSVAAISDLDGDGKEDIVIGAPGNAPGGRYNAGSVYIYYSYSETLVRRHDGQAGGIQLGRSVAAIGDQDDDGKEDLLIGAPYADPSGIEDAGTVYVYSSASGNLLGQVNGSVADEEIGARGFGTIGDQDGDGKDELLVTARMVYQPYGSVYMYSASGDLLRQFEGGSTDGGFGWAVCAVGDQDGDGREDVLIGARYSPSCSGEDCSNEGAKCNTGAANVYSSSGNLLHRFVGESGGLQLGGAVAAIDDQTGDGRDDFLMGASGAFVEGSIRAGKAYLYTMSADIQNQVWQRYTVLPDAFDLDDYFRDPNNLTVPSANQTLAYSVSGNSMIDVDIDPVTHEVSFSQPGGWVGAETVTFRATDPYGLYTDSNPVSLAVVTGYDTSVTVADAAGRSGTIVNLTATLRNMPGNIRLSNRAIAFRVDGTIVGIATTDAAGIASLDYAIPPTAPSGDQTITAEFHGDRAFNGSYGEGTLSVRGAIYVKWDSPNNGPGYDWEHAYHSVQAGLNVAVADDEIWVAGATDAARQIDPLAGLYVENMVMTDGVKLLGGYEGIADNRDPQTFITILDGGDSGSVVTVSSCASAGTLIDGFTIQNGWAEMAEDYHGGGIRCEDSSPTISGNVMTGNVAWAGGGIWCYSSSPVIENNVISGNVAMQVEHFDGFGGGIYCRYGSPVIRHNTISDGYANSGAGIYCTSSSATIHHNAIYSNSASWEGDCSGGGIMCEGSGAVTVTNNSIRGNDAWYGAGILCASTESTVANNEIVQNAAESFGGGIYCLSSSALIANNTIAENTAAGVSVPSADGGGVLLCGDAATLVNNIVAFCSSGVWKDADCSLTINNNDVYGNTEYDYSGMTDPTGSDGNISEDPWFTSRGDGDYHIEPDSPCLDAGSNAAVELDWVDIDGEARIQPEGGTVDIGADECQPDLYTWREYKPDGTEIVFGPVPVTAVFEAADPSGQNWVYVEEMDRAAGIRVCTPETFSIGELVRVSGTMQVDNDSGERYILADSGYPESTGASLNVEPLGMRNQWLGGGEVYGVYRAPISFGFGIYNVGLLVQSWGEVTYVDASGEYFYLDDGSDLADGSGQSGVRVLLSGQVQAPSSGAYVRVTGISTDIPLGANWVRALRPRSQSDIQTVTNWFNDPIALIRDELNMVALPGIPRYPHPTSVFVSCPGSPPIPLDYNLARYDSLTQAEVMYYSGGAEFGNCLMADGFYFYIAPDGSDCYDYLRSQVSGDQLISLPKGSTTGQYISLVGSPYDYTRPWSACKITNGRSVLSVSDAISVGWLHAVFGWNGSDFEEITDLGNADIIQGQVYMIQPAVDDLALLVPAQ